MFPNWWRRWESNAGPQHRKFLLSEQLSFASPFFHVLWQINTARQSHCWPYLRSLSSSIPVSVVSIPVVVFPSISAFSSVLPVPSLIYIVFTGVYTNSALFAAPSIFFTSAAKRVFPSWGFQPCSQDWIIRVKLSISASCVTENVKIVTHNDRDCKGTCDVLFALWASGCHV